MFAHLLIPLGAGKTRPLGSKWAIIFDDFAQICIYLLRVRLVFVAPFDPLVILVASFSFLNLFDRSLDLLLLVWLGVITRFAA
jgi:hypothetical protein